MGDQREMEGNPEDSDLTRPEDLTNASPKHPPKRKSPSTADTRVDEEAGGIDRHSSTSSSSASGALNVGSDEPVAKKRHHTEVKERRPVTATRQLALKHGLPKRWLYCPPMGKVIADKFLPLKTPLDACYDELIDQLQYRFHPSDVFDHHPDGKRIGLWLDFTMTDRYYNAGEVESHSGVIYKKLPLAGHDERPTVEQVARFIRLVNGFFETHPGKLVALHCTHGFNRTGFLVSAYLVEAQSYGWTMAVEEFAQGRPNGIYKPDYLAELRRRYGDAEEDAEPINLLDRPYWEEGPVADDEFYFGYKEGYEPPAALPSSQRPSTSQFSSSNGYSTASTNAGTVEKGQQRSRPLFMDGLVPAAVYVDNAEEREYVQEKVRRYLAYRGKGFPGSQPVSLDGPTGSNNIQMLSAYKYMVSWKADGVRYLVLIEGEDQIYAFDRDNNVFRISQLHFPTLKDPNQHIQDTLIDAEMIMEKLVNGNMPRLLIYDIMRHEGVDVGKEAFPLRFDLIHRQLIEPRVEAMKAGRLLRESECMSVRRKDFYFLEVTHKLFEEKFIATVKHDMDGLIFQPCETPYTPGRCQQLLKWKPPDECTIDFKLDVKKVELRGELPTWLGNLHVLHSDKPFSRIEPVTKELRAKYDGKIVECAYDKVARQWVIKRERTDKSFPNAFDTAASVLNTIQYPIHRDILLDYIARYGRKFSGSGGQRSSGGAQQHHHPTRMARDSDRH